MKTLTAANAVIILTAPPVWVAPQQLQGFATDDIFNTPALEAAEASMGVDGRLSAGFVFVPTRQEYNLQADSDSIEFFDQLYLAERTNRDKYAIGGTIRLSSVGKQWDMVRGFLQEYPPIPSAGKILRPRRFAILWEAAVPSVV